VGVGGVKAIPSTAAAVKKTQRQSLFFAIFVDGLEKNIMDALTHLQQSSNDGKTTGN